MTGWVILSRDRSRKGKGRSRRVCSLYSQKKRWKSVGCGKGRNRSESPFAYSGRLEGW